MNRTAIARAIASVLLLSGVLAACGGGASEGEFVKACMEQGQHAMVMEAPTEKMCKCMAHESKAALPAISYKAMVLDMQGKKQEAEKLLGDLPFEKRAEFGMKQFEVLGKCLPNG